jgi:hypothetical protein
MRRTLAILAIASSGCLLEFDERLVQLQVVCERPGIIRCYGFDDPADLELRTGGEFTSDPACRDEECTQHVTDEIVSGTGAVRFEIAPGSDGPPIFELNFADDLSRHVGEGESLYVQWRQRMSADFIREFPSTDDRTANWWQMQLGAGDREGTEVDMCTSVDVGLAQDTRFMGPSMWVGCDERTELEEYVEETSDVLLQTGPDARCLYSDPTVPPCVAYEPDRWTAYQVQVEIDTWQNTHIRMWMVDPPGPRRVVFDSVVAVPAATGDALGKIWLGPQMYFRDTAGDYPSGFTWYDNLVISTEEIPDPDL